MGGRLHGYECFRLLHLRPESAFFVARIWAVAAFIIFCASIDDRKHYASKGRNKQFQFSNMPILHKTDESNA
jgi:hypothetical protein